LPLVWIGGTDAAANHQARSSVMNWDQIQGNWKQIKGKVKEKWGKLSDDQLDQLAGNRDQLVGKIQEQYGISKDEAEKQLRDWTDRQGQVDPNAPGASGRRDRSH
jgi:uncharacterized protein YjbJ (UPF0337 family)